MSDTDKPTPRPTSQHIRLRELAGTWNVDCMYYTDPSQPPMKVEAKETVRMLGDFWSVSRFEADMMGAPFEGQATLGFDPAKSEWVSTWIDTMNPQMYRFVGVDDPDSDVLTMTGENPSPFSGEPANHRTTEEYLDANTRRFEMFVELPDGAEHKVFTYVYRRAKS